MSSSLQVPDTELAGRHSFALPARCQQIIEIHDAKQLRALTWTANTLILGEGTNTLFVENFAGNVIVNKLMGVRIEETADAYLVCAQAGENWHQFVVELNRLGIFGLENLALIPGTVGAAPVQNIGAYGVEVGTFIDAVEAWDCIERKARRWHKSECDFGYRMSKFKAAKWRHMLITAVHFRFPKHWQPVLDYKELQSLPSTVSAAELMQRVIDVRKEKLPDPVKLPNAGSFFKNPTISLGQANALKHKYPDLPCYPQDNEQVKIAAGWLIDKAGLKGARFGGATVHQRQALVLVNAGGATGEDVQQLATHIQNTVYERYGVTLEPEVRMIKAHGLVAS